MSEKETYHVRCSADIEHLKQDNGVYKFDTDNYDYIFFGPMKNIGYMCYPTMELLRSVLNQLESQQQQIKDLKKNVIFDEEHVSLEYHEGQIKELKDQYQKLLDDTFALRYNSDVHDQDVSKIKELEARPTIADDIEKAFEKGKNWDEYCKQQYGYYDELTAANQKIKELNEIAHQEFSSAEFSDNCLMDLNDELTATQATLASVEKRWSTMDIDSEFFPEYHEEAMGCGLEDRNITDRYDAMYHGWDYAIDRMIEFIAGFRDEALTELKKLKEMK